MDKEGGAIGGEVVEDETEVPLVTVPAMVIAFRTKTEEARESTAISGGEARSGMECDIRTASG